ncbi:MAG: hypothetical protein RSE41_06960 [Clostridia bacterium]
MENLFLKIINTYRIEDILRKVHLLLTVFIVLWLNAGVFQYVGNKISMTIKCVLVIVWLCISILNRDFIKNVVKNIWPLFLFFIILLLSKMLYNNETISTLIYQSFYLIIISCIFLYYSTNEMFHERKVILCCLILDYAYVSFNTIRILIESPEASRYLSTTPEIIGLVFGDKNISAIGTYSYAYALVPLMIYIFWRGWENKKNVYFLILLYGIVVLIMMKFTISIILLLFFIGLIIFIEYLKKHKHTISIKNLLFRLVFLAIIVLLLFKIILIFKLLPDVILVRIQEIFDLFSFNLSTTSDLYTRIDLYNKSVISFINSPLYGSFGAVVSYSGHSTYLDMLAYFGVISGLLFLYFKKMYLLLYKKRFIIKILFVYLLVLGLVNNSYLSTIFLCLFIFIPFLEIEEDFK